MTATKFSTMYKSITDKDALLMSYTPRWRAPMFK